jgi:hypothetical protein
VADRFAGEATSLPVLVDRLPVHFYPSSAMVQYLAMLTTAGVAGCIKVLFATK